MAAPTGKIVSKFVSKGIRGVKKFGDDFFDNYIDDISKAGKKPTPATKQPTAAEKQKALQESLKAQGLIDTGGREVAPVVSTFKPKPSAKVTPPVKKAAPVKKAVPAKKVAAVKPAAKPTAAKPTPPKPPKKAAPAKAKPTPVKDTAPVKKATPLKETKSTAKETKSTAKKTGTKSKSTSPSRTPEVTVTPTPSTGKELVPYKFPQIATGKEIVPYTGPNIGKEIVPYTRTNIGKEIVPYTGPNLVKYDSSKSNILNTINRGKNNFDKPTQFGKASDEFLPPIRDNVADEVLPGANIAEDVIAPTTDKLSILARLKGKKPKLPSKKTVIKTGIAGGALYGLAKIFGLGDASPTEAAAAGEVEPILGNNQLPDSSTTPGGSGGIGGGTDGGIIGDGGNYPAGSDAALVESIVQDALDKLENGIGTKEDADVIAEAGSNELDNSVDNALQGLIDAYGSPEAIENGVAQQDPLLLQQLAGIEADYQAGLAQIKEGYAAALQLVGGYQNEANALLADSTKNMAASFEAAAVGMQGMGMSSGIPEYTALEGGISGISDTALGGAGITGAALGRGMSGAAQAQGLVQQLELGTTLGGQRAEGALSQADLEAALAREALGAKTGARTDSAERLSAERLAREEQARLDAQRIAEFKYNRALQLEEVARNEQATEEERQQAMLELRAQAQMDLANKVVGMSAEERRAFLGQTGTAAGTPSPSWYGTRFQGPANSGIKGLLSSDGTKVPITVNTANQALDYLDAYLQNSEATGQDAFPYWTEFYNQIGPDAIRIYGTAGRPTTATQMIQELFG